ncbi:rhodanese-like domain-containing protein [Parapusillimonas sp. JC17]|uniref:rhodanese-like domain-containing protein n=1 Tax=Parapusillimonas sp. JC17 TaxID=3445768 RepID=UPI003FA0A3CF
MSIMQQRYDSVRTFMETLEDLAVRHTGQQLRERIAPLLIELGNQTELFPPDEFSLRPGKPGGLYQLWRGLNGDLALYASAGKTGKKQPPHDHTTWAVIAGVFGEEHNVFFERIDDRSVEGQGILKQVDELTVRAGNAATLSGEVFHTIEVVSEEDSLHLHLYGRALDTLSGRVNFTSETGGAYSRFMAIPETYAPWIDARSVYDMLTDGKEFAILDVRENGVYTQGHIFHAASMPLSVLELRIALGLPSPHTRIVLIDDDDGLAVSAARQLQLSGYHNVAVLKGGQQAWNDAGFPVYSGVFVPSKAFGEIVEHHYGTPHITAQELAELRTTQDILVLDSRTQQEFHMMSIPGAYSCPGGELVARAFEHEGPIVVNCAGRTRSILGAQSLINAGLNNVRALENGTMGQYLAGLPLDRDRTDSYLDRPVAPGAREAARREAERLGIGFLSPDETQSLCSDAERVTYLFDVRDPALFERSSLDGSVSAPGGQLVQQTDQYAPIRNARIVVFDTDGVQAPMTATWLHRMGWEVYVCTVAPEKLVQRPRPLAGVDEHALELASIPEQAIIIDVGDSRAYRKAHLAGAAWTVRSRLSRALAGLDKTSQLVFTCQTGEISSLAAQDARALGHDAVFLNGGVHALPPSCLTGEAPNFLTETDDVWYRPYDRETGIEEAMHQYLSWEVGLLEKVRADRTVAFRI